ncbi:MAG: hypothetical protein AAF743_02395 [Planctomycetota bacterium]
MSNGPKHSLADMADDMEAEMNGEPFDGRPGSAFSVTVIEAARAALFLDARLAETIGCTQHEIELFAKGSRRLDWYQLDRLEVLFEMPAADFVRQHRNRVSTSVMPNTSPTPSHAE